MLTEKKVQHAHPTYTYTMFTIYHSSIVESSHLRHKSPLYMCNKHDKSVCFSQPQVLEQTLSTLSECDSSQRGVQLTPPPPPHTHTYKSEQSFKLCMDDYVTQSFLRLQQYILSQEIRLLFVWHKFFFSYLL